VGVCSMRGGIVAGTNVDGVYAFRGFELDTVK
jgi:hypothetical protein